MKDFRQHILSPFITARQALQKLDAIPGNKTLFITDAAGKLLGSLTDGDIRRGVLDGLDLNEAITRFMCLDPVFLVTGSFTMADLDRCLRKKPNLLPMVDDNRHLVAIKDLTRQRSVLPVTALIMAGGKGERLAPLTDNVPKPLLRVGDKPILEHIIKHLASYGIENIYLAVNYLNDQIKAYFGSGSELGVSIHYLDEKQPLGTIGAAQYLPDTISEDLLVVNGDILTNFDIEDFYRTFWNQNAAMAVATVPYHVSVPYAVVDVKHNAIVSLTEKPTFTYQANAGIYFLKQEVLKLLPAGQCFDATDLVLVLLAKKRKVVPYQILNYWLDIGSPADYQKAREVIDHLKH